MAKCGFTNINGGGGLDTDELTASAADVLLGKKAGIQGSDEPVNGTMPNRGAVSVSLNAGGNYTISAGYHNGSGKITANSLASQTSATAIASKVLNGYTAWVNGIKITGDLSVQSILSFSAAVYSSTAIAFTWKNPSKGPFAGVIIVGKTGSYPTSISDGTRYYKGAGSNTAASGTSSVILSSFSSGITYYFRAFSYSTLSSSEWIHSTSYTATTATTKGQQVITSSGIFTVPAGVRTIDVFVVGGGAGGGYGSSNNDSGGRGGCSGKTATLKNISVSPGQQFSVIIGSGGRRDKSSTYAGSETSFGSLISAAGGTRIGATDYGSGGSGGGVGYNSHSSSSNKHHYSSAGGSDGSDGIVCYTHGGAPIYGGTGQHTTTRAFGESSNTLYAGGGSGGGESRVGASGGGGTGGGFRTPPTDGTANTGGGGGGGGREVEYHNQYGGAGGSGICIVRWGY